MIFEMLTGDFLFDPRKGPNFGKDDDHLAQIIELTRMFPKHFALSGLKSRKFFDRTGDLRRVKNFHYWTIHDVLKEKYKMKEVEAEALANFLLPMLEACPDKRISAREALNSEWLRMPPVLETQMSIEEQQKYIFEKNLRAKELIFEKFPAKIEGVENDADSEDASDLEGDFDKDIQNRNHVLDMRKKTILDRSFFHGGYIGFGAVSYTHLTLPTIYSV
eukprot:TRINITY_DN6482_c0_g1_i11.p1 TRINITY_DN6482_c0_g1~~TRINITY_DN6482_c0_g1_i11.p1  ORF type:complete len:219 (+),score=43.98 TRINITY_DN6482_c0_g1_i11:216-872(+)